MSGWQTIDTHPTVALKGWEQPNDCIVYCPEFGGVTIGKIYRYEDGRTLCRLPWVHGDLTFTHWQPLPDKPEGT